MPSVPLPAGPSILRYGDIREQIEQQNASLLQEAEQFNLQQTSRQKWQQALINEALSDYNQQKPSLTETSDPVPVTYQLPSFEKETGTAYYQQAVEQLQQMLSGSQPLSLKKAVFLVENAYYGNMLKYDDFEASIQQIVRVCEAQLLADGFTLDNPLAKIRAIHQYMADTLQVKLAGQRRKVTHFPFRYDFDDIYGEKDWSKQFVTKLIQSNAGQCHSLPLLYLIVAQEMEAEAYWAFAPSHSYVKFKDDKKQWHNLELTHGKISSNAWLVASGYVKAEAIRNKIYLQPMSLEQTVAYALIDLAKGYQKRFGMDGFTLTCVEQNLRYHPANIVALQMKSDYYYKLNLHVLKQLHSKEELERDAQASVIFQEGEETYQQVETMGYAEMPKEAYETWLKTFEEEKLKQNQPRPNH